MWSRFALCFLLTGCGVPLLEGGSNPDQPEATPVISAPEPTADVTPQDTPTAGSRFGGMLQGLLRPKPIAPEPTAQVDAQPQQTEQPTAAVFPATATSSAVPEVPQGTKLAYGDIARVCGMSRGDYGKRIEKAAGYTLYDSDATTTAPRTFYLTGFPDGCARQFTAALALVSGPARHEEFRYGRPSDLYPYSDIDRAYERVKSRVCRVPRRKPCGSSIRKLERNTIFISTYERFTGNARWADILVHNGAVLAKGIKS